MAAWPPPCQQGLAGCPVLPPPPRPLLPPLPLPRGWATAAAKRYEARLPAGTVADRLQESTRMVSPRKASL